MARELLSSAVMRHIGCGLLLAVLAGCPNRTIAVVSPTDNGVITKDVPVGDDVDILFLIDDSPSTKDKQQLFASNIEAFVQKLDEFPGGRPNLHIGVVSSTIDLGSAAAAIASNCPSPPPNDDGRLHNSPGSNTTCTPPTDHYISDVLDADGVSRDTNYGATGSQGATEQALEDTLGCISQLGDSGCGFEAPLEAIHRALDGSVAENDGFLRPGAYLAIVILTDEDDCSLKDQSIFNLSATDLGGTDAADSDFRCQPMFAYACDQMISGAGPGTYTNCRVRTDSYLQDPQVYAAFLGGIKDPSQIVVALIGGGGSDGAPVVAPATIATGKLTIEGQPPQQLALMNSCSAQIGSDTALGRPAIRLMDFVQQFGDNGLFQTVCQSDYTMALTSIGELLATAFSPCLEDDVDASDTDPNNPGIQPACVVQDVGDAGSASEPGPPIPTCPMASPGVPAANAPTPCWYVRADSACTTTSGLELTVTGPAPPVGTVEQVECVAM